MLKREAREAREAGGARRAGREAGGEYSPFNIERIEAIAPHL